MRINIKTLIKVIVAVIVLTLAVVLCVTASAEDESFNTCEQHTAEIIGANVSLDKDISLRYYVKLCDCYKNAKMVFSMGGESVTKAAYYDAETEEYVYTLNGIAPQTMGDLIFADLVCDGNVIASKSGYRVLDYCLTLMDTYKDDEELQYLIKALLNYGAASQNYNEYDLDNLVNAGLEIDSLRPGEADSVKEIINNNGDAAVKAANMTFGKTNKVYIKVVCEYEPTVTVDGAVLKAQLSEETEDSGEGTSKIWLFYTDGISPDSFDQELVFEITSNDPVTELTYSVNSYIYSMLDSQKASIRNLAMALYTYGVATEGYLATR